MNEWVPVCTSVFPAPQSHLSAMLACATVQVVPVWVLPGHVRCPQGSCRLHRLQASAVSFTTTNLLEVGSVGGWVVVGGYLRYVFALQMCVYRMNHCRVVLLLLQQEAQPIKTDYFTLNHFTNSNRKLCTYTGCSETITVWNIQT